MITKNKDMCLINKEKTTLIQWSRSIHIQIYFMLVNWDSEMYLRSRFGYEQWLKWGDSENQGHTQRKPFW